MPPKRPSKSKARAKETEKTVSVGQCKSITVLKTKPEPEKAMALLQKIATLVAPIMRAHGWELPLLCEFFPKKPELLGMNRNMGAQIYIRLRPHHDETQFHDLEQNLIGTMLHELTHNVYGPHDEKFYKFLDGLQDEYDDLRRKGYSGEGFLGDGNRVGKGVAISDASVPLHVAREKALQQAERRAKLNAVMGPSGGQRLGGAKVDKYRSPREAMAAAAERRARDQKACNHDDDEIEAEAARAQQAAVSIDIGSDDDGEGDSQLPSTLPPSKSDSLSKSKSTAAVLDLASSDSDDAAPIASSSRLPPVSKVSVSSAQSSSSQPAKTVPAKRPPSATTLPEERPLRTDVPPDAWSCPTCTFDNLNPLALTCEICNTPRPTEDEYGWRCQACATRNEHQFFSCKGCATIKSTSSYGASHVLTRSSAVLH